MNEALQSLATTVRLMEPAQLPLRLRFGLSCAQRVAHLLLDPRATAGVATLQAFLEGRGDELALEAARREVEAVARSHPGSSSIDGAAHGWLRPRHARRAARGNRTWPVPPCRSS